MNGAEPMSSGKPDLFFSRPGDGFVEIVVQHHSAPELMVFRYSPAALLAKIEGMLRHARMASEYQEGDDGKTLSETC